MTRDEQWLLEEKHGGKETTEYEADKERLAEGEPLAYVIGWQPFLGLKIYLDSHPIIPRPETEWWTEQLLNSITTNSQLTTLDICAGSGAIGCAMLARLPNAQVYFGEIDPMHEMTMLKNIRENGLDASRAHIRIGDLFRPFADMRFDSIAANPPYVPASRELPKSVADYEPPLALLAGEDGLAIIRRIAAELSRHLVPGGTAWIECDSGRAEETRMLFETQGLRVKMRTDQYGEFRFIVISFP